MLDRRIEQKHSTRTVKEHNGIIAFTQSPVYSHFFLMRWVSMLILESYPKESKLPS